MRALPWPVFTVLVVTAGPACAHFNMLLPSAASGKKGEAVTFTYQWGHPFEHQLFDAPKPEKLAVRAPDGTTEDLTKTLAKVAIAAEGEKVTGYSCTFTPAQRGDYVFLLQLAPIFLPEEDEFVEDVVKVVFHVQAQKGWDASVGDSGFEWAPLTRPYGLEPGMAFQAVTLPAALVEVERYNSTPPKKLPPDEQITRVVKAGPNGVVTCTLTDPGWWCLTATASARGKRTHDGKEKPLRQRATLWVFVDEKPAR